MKFIINCEENEAEDVLRLMLEKKHMFETGQSRPGWGWVFYTPAGKGFFVREIKGGLSASPAKRRETPPKEEASA